MPNSNTVRSYSEVIAYWFRKNVRARNNKYELIERAVSAYLAATDIHEGSINIDFVPSLTGSDAEALAKYVAKVDAFFNPVKCSRMPSEFAEHLLCALDDEFYAQADNELMLLRKSLRASRKIVNSDCLVSVAVLAVREGAEASAATAELIASSDDITTLMNAKRETAESIEADQALLMAIQNKINKVVR